MIGTLLFQVSSKPEVGAILEACIVIAGALGTVLAKRYVATEFKSCRDDTAGVARDVAELRMELGRMDERIKGIPLAVSSQISIAIEQLELGRLDERIRSIPLSVSSQIVTAIEQRRLAARNEYAMAEACDARHKSLDREIAGIKSEIRHSEDQDIQTSARVTNLEMTTKAHERT